MAAMQRKRVRGRMRRPLRCESLESRCLLAADVPLAKHPQLGEVARIVGGIESEPGAWPWMASLQSAGHFCGASLIAPDAVVTAAHCVEGNSVDDFEVVVGGYDLRADEGKRHQVAEIIVHPDYDAFRNDSDLAILLLASPSDTKPVPVLGLQQAELAAAGNLARVLGWGRLAESGAVPETLHEVTVPIVANEIANAPQSYDGAVTERMLAAGLAAGGKDACQGDSGGPLLVSDGNGQSYLAGVVSFGNGCAAQPIWHLHSNQFFCTMDR